MEYIRVKRNEKGLVQSLKKAQHLLESLPIRYCAT